MLATFIQVRMLGRLQRLHGPCPMADRQPAGPLCCTCTGLPKANSSFPAASLLPCLQTAGLTSTLQALSARNTPMTLLAPTGEAAP